MIYFPCPFCGDEADGDELSCVVQCRKSSPCVIVRGRTPLGAARRWNSLFRGLVHKKVFEKRARARAT